MRYFLKSFSLSDAQDITMVTDEAMRMMVLSVASGTFRNSRPWCQVPGGAPVRSSTYEENRAPNSITSEARKSQTPSLALNTPVSGRASTV
jgi:hypothetical protein